MTAKEYLQQAYQIHRSIQARKQQVARLRELAECATSIANAARVSGTPARSKVESTVCRIADLQAMIQRDLCRLAEKYEEIQRIIDKVEEGPYRDLLIHRYLNFSTWVEIESRMAYSHQHMMRLHGSALEKISDILKDETQ